ncbi:hypothetical protein LCGC14_1627790, partial [marine sediment metagenome]
VTNRARQRLSQQETLLGASDLNQVMTEQYISQGRPVWEMTRDTRETIGDLTTLGQYSRAARLADAYGIQSAERLDFISTRGTTVDDLADVIARDIQEASTPIAAGLEAGDDLQDTMELINDLSIGPETTGRVIRQLDNRLELLRSSQLSLVDDLNDIDELGLPMASRRARRDALRENIDELDELTGEMLEAKATLQVNQETFETAFGGLASVENATTAATLSISPGLEALHALRDSRAFTNLMDVASLVPEGRGAPEFLRTLKVARSGNYSRARLQERLSGLSREGQMTVKKVLEQLKQTDRLAASAVPVRRALQAVRRLLSAE